MDMNQQFLGKNNSVATDPATSSQELNAASTALFQTASSYPQFTALQSLSPVAVQQQQLKYLNAANTLGMNNLVATAPATSNQNPNAAAAAFFQTASPYPQLMTTQSLLPTADQRHQLKSFNGADAALGLELAGMSTEQQQFALNQQQLAFMSEHLGTLRQNETNETMAVHPITNQTHILVQRINDTLQRVQRELLLSRSLRPKGEESKISVSQTLTQLSPAVQPMTAYTAAPITSMSSDSGNGTPQHSQVFSGLASRTTTASAFPSTSASIPFLKENPRLSAASITANAISLHQASQQASRNTAGILAETTIPPRAIQQGTTLSTSSKQEDKTQKSQTDFLFNKLIMKCQGEDGQGNKPSGIQLSKSTKQGAPAGDSELSASSSRGSSRKEDSDSGDLEYITSSDCEDYGGILQDDVAKRPQKVRIVCGAEGSKWNSSVSSTSLDNAGQNIIQISWSGSESADKGESDWDVSNGGWESSASVGSKASAAKRKFTKISAGKQQALSIITSDTKQTTPSTKGDDTILLNGLLRWNTDKERLLAQATMNQAEQNSISMSQPSLPALNESSIPLQSKLQRTGSLMGSSTHAVSLAPSESSSAASDVNSIQTMSGDRQDWSVMFSRLCKYKTANGDCNVTRLSHTDPQLAMWCNEQRDQQNSLNKQKKCLLTKLGFSLTGIEPPDKNQPWDSMFAKLVKYKEEHGACNIPTRYSADLPLGRWVEKQRIRKDDLPPLRKKKLDSIGFVWSVHGAYWDDMFQSLVAFKKEYSHCRVPRRYSKNRKLGKWVDNQRCQIRKGRMSQPRLKLLESIGFAR